MTDVLKSFIGRLCSVKFDLKPPSEFVPVNRKAAGVKDSLQVELEKQNKKLFTTKLVLLKTAQAQFLNGMIAMKRGEAPAATDFFKGGAQYALDAFQSSRNIGDKILSTRIRVLCVLSLHKNRLGDYKSVEFTQEELSSALTALIEADEVKKAMRNTFKANESAFACPCSSGALKSKSGKVLMEVSSMIHFAEENLQFTYKVPSVTPDNSDKSVASATSVVSVGSVVVSKVSDSSSVNSSSISSISSSLTTELSLKSIQAKLKGHRNRVTCFATSEQYLFSGSKDTHIRVWDVKTLALKGILRGHTHAVSSLVVAEELGALYSSSGDGTVRKWDLATLKEVGCSVPGADFTVRSLAVDVVSLSVFAGCNDGVIRKLDLTTLVVKSSMRAHSAWVSCLAVSGDRLFSGSVDSSVAVWDTESLMCVHRMHGHTGYVTAMVVAGDRLFTGSSDRTVRVWELRGGENDDEEYTQVGMIEQTAAALPLKEQDCSVRSLAVTNNKLFIGCANDNIRVFALSNLSEEIQTIKAKPTSFDNCLAVADGKMFIGSAGKTIHVHLL